MVSDTNFLYFNIYGGPLQKVAHADTVVTTALPQDPGANDRYEVQMDQDGFLYWSNGSWGGGDPGEIRKSSLSTQQDVWTAAGLNGARNLQIVNGYVYFVNDWQEVRRITLSGTGSETLYRASTNTIYAMVVAPDGDIFFGQCPECPFTHRSVVSVLPAGDSIPVDITTRDGGTVDHMQISQDKVYVVDRELIYSIDLADASVSQLVNLVSGTTFSFSVDDKGMYWVMAFPDFGIFASYLDGSHITNVGTGPNVRKQGNLIYWYNFDRVLRKRTLAHS